MNEARQTEQSEVGHNTDTTMDFLEGRKVFVSQQDRVGGENSDSEVVD